MTHRSCFLTFIFLSCLALGCGPQQETNKLIKEMSAERVKYEALAKQAEAKRAEAAEESDDRRRKLIEEAAKLYGQVAELLSQSADKADQIVKLDNPPWHKQYFTLQSRWIRNVARTAANAQQELLVRNGGEPSEAQVKSWREDISKVAKENKDLLEQMVKLESEHGSLKTTN